MLERRRVDNEPAFVLHTWPYSETSLLIEVFTRSFGRLPLLAKGARRPRSVLRGQLMQFQPLQLGWAGRGEVRTLMRCEWVGGQPLPTGDALLCAFYMNELLMRLLPREDAHEALFDDYAEALIDLSAPGAVLPLVLRRFERRLLKELGYALTLDREAGTGAPIDPEGLYRYEPELGAIRVEEPSAEGPAFPGRSLLAIGAEHYAEAAILQQCKQLMRLLINHRLDRQPLHSRTVFKDLQQL